MKTQPPLRPAPPLTLPGEVKAVADYLSARHGIHHGVVTTALLTALGAVAGGFRAVNWRDEQLGMNLQIFLLPGTVVESLGWLDMLAAPLAFEVARLREEAGDPRQLEIALRQCHETFQKTNREDPKWPMVRNEFRRLAELCRPHLLLRTLPRPGEDDNYDSTLVVDGSGALLRAALAEIGLVNLRRLAFGDRTEHSCRNFTLLLQSPAGLITAMKRRAIIENWCPLILPQHGVPITATNTTREEAIRQWDAVVDKALSLRRSGLNDLEVSPHGETVLNAVKDAAEAMGAKSRWPFFYSWAVSTCAKIASTLHTLGESPEEVEIAPKWWDEAQSMTSWLLEVQNRSVGVLRGATTGLRLKFHPNQQGDAARMQRLMNEQPDAKFRDLARALPKRAPGRWKMLYYSLTGVGEAGLTGSTRPTGPTSDTSIAALDRKLVAREVMLPE